MKQLVIINSYNEAAPWSHQHIRAALILVSKLPDVEAEILNMNSTSIRNEATYRLTEDNIMEHCKGRKPDYLLLIGNLAFNMRDRIRKEWGDVPILLISDIDKYAPLNYYYTGQYIDYLPEYIRPLSELQGKYNFTMIKTPIKYEETIDMMVRMLPQMKTLVFVADELYMNRRLEKGLNAYVAQKYPWLKLKDLPVTADNKQNFHHMLLDEDPTCGILFSSCFYEQPNMQGMPSVKTGAYRLSASSPQSIFVLRRSYAEDGGFVGGYFQDPTEVDNRLITYLQQLIDGKPARDIPFYHCRDFHPFVDYQQLTLKEIPESLCPEDTVFINKPLSFWSKYKYQILIGGIVIAFLVTFFIFKYIYQRKKIHLLEVYRNLLRNMPILYMQGKVVFNERKEVTDIKYIIGNTAFNDHFLQRKDADGKNAEFSSLWELPSMFPSIAEVVRKQHMVSFISKNKEVSPCYDYIICPSVERDVVDIFGIDVTVQHETERELIAAKEQAQESDRLKSAFLANMSHEIRTPLNAIVGFSDLLADTDDLRAKKDFSKLIKTNNKLLLQLINDILDLAKIDAGTLEFNYRNVNLNELMENVKSTVSGKLQAGVILNVTLGAEHCHVYTEYNRVSQVLINLLTNACKFTKQGCITFGYRLEGKNVCLYVQDTGCGIPTDKLNEVFERFTKLNSFAQGTGLGLSICQNIVKKMGGEIKAESEGEGKGATFSFTIPYLPVEVHEEEEMERAATILEETESLSENRKTILVAEDSENNYELFRAIMGHNYNLIHAWDGVEAVELFRQNRPDLVIMDITMPRMDGYEATREIRKLSADVPVIAVTANAFASDRERVLRNGFNAYMAKPITPAKLMAEIKSMI